MIGVGLHLGGMQRFPINQFDGNTVVQLVRIAAHAGDFGDQRLKSVSFVSA